MVVKLGILLSFASAPFSHYHQVGDVQGITYANAQNEVYVPIRELGQVTGLLVEWNDAEQQIVMQGQRVDRKVMRKLWNGVNLFPISGLAK